MDTSTLPRRFYKKARVQDAEGGFSVALDQRTLRTPKGAPFLAPTQALAQAVAAEWAAQGERLYPATMPLTQLAFAAVDWTAPSRAERALYVAGFGAADLCCHRAEAPTELAARQAAAWDPLVAWADEALGVALPVVAGIVAADVGAESLESLRAHAEALDDFRLTALSQAAGLAGSAIIAFALVRGRIGAAEAYAAAALDDLWSLERWGEDAQARARLDRVRAEFEALAAFIQALSS
jgi:chaperone required for assembly of F1-ATPase